MSQEKYIIRYTEDGVVWQSNEINDFYKALEIYNWRLKQKGVTNISFIKQEIDVDALSPLYNNENYKENVLE